MTTLADNTWILTSATLAGPLLAAGLAKLLAPADRIVWPVRRGPLRAPFGPKLVGAAELFLAAGIVTLPGRWPAGAALLAYAGLTAAAVATRGQACACFGVAALAAVGRAHIGLNALAAATAGGLAVVGSRGSAGPLLPALVALGSAAVTFTWVLLRNRGQHEPDAAVPCGSLISAVQLYLSDDCPSCRSLKHLLTGVEPERLRTLRTTVVVRDSELPPGMQHLGVPCAQGLDQEGNPVCTPVSGIGGVKALIDTVTIQSAVVAHVD